MFSDKYINRVLQTKSHLCVGLDPNIKKFPNFILKKAEEKYGKNPQGAGFAIFEFNKMIIDLASDHAPAVKPQLAYYEKYGQFGIEAFWETVNYAQKQGLLVIADAKRGDIGTTSQAYAEAFFVSDDRWSSQDSVDAVTVNPFLGSDGIDPFIDVSRNQGAGVIILVKTSNPSSGEIQDKIVAGKNKTVSEVVCDYINSKTAVVGEYGFSDIGAVIGATYPEELAKFRKLLPNSLLLIPGIGAQGGEISLLASAFNDQGLGAIINSARAIDYAYCDQTLPEEKVKELIRQAIDQHNEAINVAVRKAGKKM